jgi:alpha-L-fucosidase
MSSPVDRLSWFHDARFGMFIHWGVYAVPARNEWAMLQDRIPADEYARFADDFRAERYDPAAWVALAREAGMRYMVLTTRHHDGFSLFDSRHSDFTATKTAAGRDLVAEFADACHAAGMRLGLYYSLGDWRYPAQFRGPEQDPAGWAALVDYAHAQVRELMTNYGRVDLLWYDGAFTPGASSSEATAHAWRAAELNAMVRSLQPDILINDRSGLPEDFTTPEQQIRPAADGRAWEACMTMNRQWGYVADGSVYKMTKELLIFLTACASGAGNFLLNVGPMADGTMPEPSVTRLREMGAWLRVHGESIYGSARCALDPGTNGVFTQKDGRVYLHVHWWPGSVVTIPSIRNRVRRATVVGTGQEAVIEHRGTRVLLTGLPATPPDPCVTVIALDLDGPPEPGPDASAGW